MHYTIDLTGIATQVIALVGTIVTPVLAMLAVRVTVAAGNFFHVRVTEHDRATVETTIDNAIAWAEAQGDAIARDKGKIAVSDQNVAFIANQYVLPHAKDALARSNVPAAHLGELIAARLQQKAAA